MSGTLESLLIAVVDSGATTSHPHLDGVEIDGFGVDERGIVRRDFRDLHGHGTAVAAVIAGELAGVGILAVRVLGPDLRCGHSTLAHGIVHAADRGASLINVSMGTRERSASSVLGEAVVHAAAAGALVVAAAPPAGTAWPADLDGVIGVEGAPGCPPGRHRAVVRRLRLPGDRERDVLRFAAHGEARAAAGLPSNFTGNSLAAAHMTVIAAKAVAGKPSLDPEGVIGLLRRTGVRRSA